MSSLSSNLVMDSSLLPKHIAVIMDGNGRWAKARGKARMFGHKAGVDAVRKTVSTANRLGVEVLTLFAFSSENWRRPEEEVSLLMELFVTVLGREVKRLHKNGVKLRVIGDTSRFSKSLQDKIASAEGLTANNSGLVLNIAANYGGQWDILQAVQKLANQVADGVIPAEQLTEADISVHLTTAPLPDVDLMIRTSGECRISNFMLWQAAYAELYFTEQFWPDFNEVSLTDAIAWYVNRERRFGCTGEQIQAMLKVEK
ncbi:di-trans,poly-cis-decaprenylcistransferase [Enterovibrio norvegicus]|uniref:Ditrans,polycis-undecaprenyl-diphosphate synthase ((2E,6E)-farnesyl-diphosphate specific) n=2 Tax=Enterovibrio norvegicus TaxID=188144 RepID=A0A1I5WEE6_9GAMM|nr:isoprenyl transferase [Enterovibrio norvegicus]MCC4799312.1 isoprenyl transferase [Enterovibrio norvegicus]OEE68592.1 di-trans,poly-cis-decaprenylcistransferase [Enterovibrio norvegicus]OEF51271.1 di-trans,poly-cis-decaprenylcistransferase [Enterovibrio norvegicus]OEF59005.1 di-trans,poly-cis-decaprenylcistransferase [Enterovibrio norvegicus]PMH62013.1 di-trans,poly-cis-decaprenylcistransferase [Enterovibrio norvegicus]